MSSVRVTEFPGIPARPNLRTLLHRAALIVLLAASASVRAAETPRRVVIALAGDSTVAAKSGWGPALEKRLGPGVTCTNFALGGRSSKSFRDEGHWAKLLAANPDYVLLQFGHNDMPGKGPERETDPATTYRANLMRYVDEARAAGAKPVLITSMARRAFDGGKIRGELKPWADAARQVAAEKGVPLVDLFARSVALLENLGPEGIIPLEPPPKDGKPDHTHLSPKGAEVMADLVVQELRRVEPALGKLFDHRR